MIRSLAFAHGDDSDLQARLTAYQRHGLDSIACCGTPAAGVHIEYCDHCDDHRLVPNTCGHRSCPHCQGRERAAWVAARLKELLPCEYFHAVFTLPSAFRQLTRAYPTVMLNALTTAASDALSHLCADSRYLGGEIGQLSMVHTWKRDLGWHPHVHIIVTAGGWNHQQQRWIPARRYGRQRQAFLLPVDVLRLAFQRRFRRLLIQAYARGDLDDGPTEAFSVLQTSVDWRRFLNNVMAEKPWNLRIEPPFGGPRQLLKYLGAYVHRVAISPQRIIAYDPQAQTVTYTWKTNGDPHTPRQATIPATEFLYRFAQHILPPHFHRIRFRGLWSTAHRQKKLHHVQQALGYQPEPPSDQPTNDETASAQTTCLVCRVGHYQRRPGPCPRPNKKERQHMLQQLRAHIRSKPSPTTTGPDPTPDRPVHQGAPPNQAEALVVM